MTLKTIRIVNVKGIEDRTFPLNIIPNKPSLLYAPNGFGKSSFAIAFDSIKSNKLSLHKDNYYKGNEDNLPSLQVEYLRPDNSTVNIIADDTTNSIKAELECFVINNKVRAKSTALNYAGRTQHTASLNIDTMELIGSIPPDADFNYGIAALRAAFGDNGKVLPNLDNALNKSAFITIFIENRQQLDRLEQLTNARRISEFKQRLNQHQGTADQLLDWIENQEINGLDAIAPLRMLTDQILNLDLGFTRRAERILAVLEILSLYSQDKANFRAASERKLYLLEKASYVQSFKAFNSTWKDIRPKEKEGKLVIEFPKAHNISNGQRDILCLVTLLEIARRKLKKAASVLIIDEVFDYLDEGNLIAAQYGST